MSDEGGRNYRNGLTVTRGAQYSCRTVLDMDLARWLDQDMHAAWCKALDPDGRVPSEGISDIRRHMQHPWRVEARRVREAVLADVEEAVFEEMDFAARRYRERVREARRQGLIRVEVYRGRRAA